MIYSNTQPAKRIEQISPDATRNHKPNTHLGSQRNRHQAHTPPQHTVQSTGTPNTNPPNDPKHHSDTWIAMLPHGAYKGHRCMPFFTILMITFPNTCWKTPHAVTQGPARPTLRDQAPRHVAPRSPASRQFRTGPAHRARPSPGKGAQPHYLVPRHRHSHGL